MSIPHLHADEWQPRDVAALAVHALRSPGNLSYLDGDLFVRAMRPIVNGECAVNRLHWFVATGDGHILTESTSLYGAIHSLAA